MDASGDLFHELANGVQSTWHPATRYRVEQNVLNASLRQLPDPVLHLSHAAADGLGRFHGSRGVEENAQ